MSDIRPSFPTTENSSTGAGVPLHHALEGDAILNKNAQGAFVAKDVSGNFKYLEMDASGNLKITSQEENVARLDDWGEDTDGDNSAFSDLALITAQIGYLYRNLQWSGSCARLTVFRIIHVDDAGGTPVETVIHEFMVGEGDYTDTGALQSWEYDTTGGTGTQQFKLQAKNLFIASYMRGSLAMSEVQ